MLLPEDLNDLVLKTSLYQSYEFNDNDISKLYNYLKIKTNFDCYCIDCGKESTFISKSATHYSNTKSDQIHELSAASSVNFIARCTRNQDHYSQDHYITIIFKVDDKKITKIGQYPSIADISIVDIKKYHSLLGNEKYRELNRAAGLFSHGIGIGSFVYLRRIFEDLIEEAHLKANISSDWDELEYNKLRSMADKISTLESYLPNFLTANKGMYSILSKGIHELGEEECLEMFPIMKLSIELILDEKLQQKEREKKLSSASKAISSLVQKLKT
jgi:hypothetical protein